MLMRAATSWNWTNLAPAKPDSVNVGRVCIDSGSRTDVVEDLIIRDRRHLSEDGYRAAHHRHQQADRPGRGFARDRHPRLQSRRRRVHGRARAIGDPDLEQSSEEEKGDYGVIKEKIRVDLKRYIRSRRSSGR